MSVAEQTGATTTWKLDPSHTTIEFSVKHMMFTTVKGHFAKVQGTIVLDEADITRSSVEVDIDAASIDTREERRDAHLRSEDFFHVEQHPALTFKSTRVERIADDQLKVTGDLTIRGTTRPVVLNAEITGRGRTPFGTTVAGFSATTTLNRKDFNLNWNVALEAGGWLVGDTIKVAIEAQAVLQA
jgi:polyisoprenoid-binding protein YceI